MSVSLFNRTVQKLIKTVIANSRKISGSKRRRIILKLAAGVLKIAKKTRNRAIENIKKAMPLITCHEAYSLAIESYQNIALGALETFWLDELELEFQIDQETLNLLYSGQGIVIATLHMSCYEAIPLAIQRLTGRSTTLSKIPSNYPNAIHHYRDVDINCIDKNQPNSLFQLLDAINNRQIVSLHSDHYAKDMEVDFFQHQTRAPAGVAMLSSLAKVPLLLGYAVAKGNGKYQVFIETISSSPVNKCMTQHEAVMRKIYKRFEQIILDYPDQWYWSYKRWR